MELSDFLYLLISNVIVEVNNMEDNLSKKNDGLP